MIRRKRLGFDKSGNSVIESKKRIIQYINIKLASKGYPFYGSKKANRFLEIADDLISINMETDRLLRNYLSPPDQRIQDFLNKYFDEVIDTNKIKMPKSTFELDKHGIARVLSLSPDLDEFKSDIISSYRIEQGILHNPKNDRRTTKGVFHIAEGGLPIPDDKKAVPKVAAANILSLAFKPPKELLQLPYTSNEEEKAELFVSLLLRPKVSPEVAGYIEEKSMEIRFFAPGNLVSNLDFVESIFGNAGNPYLPENDSAIDAEHWSGHTGCVILAPHLITVTKKSLGLPNKADASEREVRDGMCWESEDELYNDGGAFKLTIRTREGIIVTVIADNYFGYSKKEIKTQIGFAANLLGNCEEEHSGGAFAFPAYSQTDEFDNDNIFIKEDHSFEEVKEMYSDIMDIDPEGFGTDKKYPNIVYVPENTFFDLNKQKVTWETGSKISTIKLMPTKTYIFPEGFKLRMEKKPETPSWRLVGTVAEGTLCHKPSTVSGGGKSEISKSISDSIISGPFFVADFVKDFDLIEEILNKDYSDRFVDKVTYTSENPKRGLLSTRRSLGSLIKLLTPSYDEFTEEYNEWLESIPQYIKGFVLIIKRFHKPEWGDNWREHFNVNTVDGKHGHKLQYHHRDLVANYLRVGFEKNGSWRIFKLRQDFIASEKIQVEDDITASIVVPTKELMYLNSSYNNSSVKFVDNCEYRFFQRPDEAINRGHDKQAESDLSSPNTFVSNFEPLTHTDSKELIEDAIGFEQFSKPIQNMITDFHENAESKYFASSAHPRIVDGSPTKNVRYLQNRPDIKNPINKYIAEIGTRFHRKIPLDKPVLNPVDAVLPGRRNNPAEPGIRPLSVYNPIHFQELPELFMDFVCSLTGKSPSTTGAGSEGALTKAPFNALYSITDLNNALLSFVLTGYNAFSTAAGYIGQTQVDHDISILIPEIWCRLSVDERDPKFLIENSYLEKLNDFDHNGEKVEASRLGYRITQKFVKTFFGRVFENPNSVFSDDVLKPEMQGIEDYVDGINNVVEAHKKVATSYFNDGSIEAAIPPIKAILSIMVNGNYEGMTITDSKVRDLFNIEYVLNSDWYKERIAAKQKKDIALFEKHSNYLNKINSDKNYSSLLDQMEIDKKMKFVASKLEYYNSDEYLESLVGTIGLDLLYKISD